MNNSEVINVLPPAKARYDWLLRSASRMWAYGVDSAVSDSEIIDWVTNFQKYVLKEEETKAGVYGKPFLHRLAWRIKNGILQKRIKRQVRRVVRKVYQA